MIVCFAPSTDPMGERSLAAATAALTSSKLTPIGGDQRRVNLNARGRLIGAADRYVRNAIDLRDSLPDHVSAAS